MSINDNNFIEFLTFIRTDFMQNFPAMDYILIGLPEDIENFINLVAINNFFNFKNPIKLAKNYRIALLPDVSVDTELDAVMEVNGHKFFANNLFENSGIKVFIDKYKFSVENSPQISMVNSFLFIRMVFYALSPPNGFVDQYKHLFFDESNQPKFRGARSILAKILFGRDAKDAGHINKKLNQLLGTTVV